MKRQTRSGSVLSTLAAVTLAAVLTLFVAGGAQALAFREDFSTGTFDNWNVSGSFSIERYETIPRAYAQKWDLTPWSGILDGNFLLLEASGGSLYTTVVPPLPAAPVALSFDYAVAWEVENPNLTREMNYLWIYARGLSGTGNLLGNAYKEIQWSSAPGRSNGVLAGNISLPGEYFTSSQPPYCDSYTIELYFSHVSDVMEQIVGIDNITLSLRSDPTPAPVPEPATCLLLASGLAGIGTLMGRKRRTAH